MDEKFLCEAMSHVGIPVIVVDEATDMSKVLPKRISATTTWRQMLEDVIELGDTVDHTRRDHAARSTMSLELLGHQTRWDMKRPVVTCPARALGRKFMAAEAAWILAGDNRLSTIVAYARNMDAFSADGQTLGGAYGPPFVDQLGYVTSCLARDRQSRQAVATLWRPRPGPDPDVPCTIALQWMVRQDRLCCVATMRSSDVWLGVPYDVFSFSAMSLCVLLGLRSRSVTDVGMGDLIFIAGSQHLYERDFDAARKCVACADDPPSPELHPGDYSDRDNLIDGLWAMARGDGVR